REAKNGKAVVQRVLADSGVEIDIINGEKEASIIASTDLRELLRNDTFYLYVDVGGGSTELTIFDKGKLVGSQSFKIGTVRILNNLVEDSVWDKIKAWIKANVPEHGQVEIIGSGGNINKLHKMSGRKVGQPLSYPWLKAEYQFLE